jgi:PAS domain S-box-containing protein
MELNTKSESEGVLILNDQGLIILINPKASQLFGFNEAELVNISIDKIVKDGLSLTQQHATPANKNELSIGIRNELKATSKDGNEFQVQISTSQFTGGKEIFTVAFVSEVSKNKSDKSLYQEDLTPVIFLILDKLLNISLINTYGCTLLGSAQETLTGLNWFENFLPLDYTRQIQSIFNKAVITGAIENYETPVLTLRGERYTIRWTTRVIYDSSGVPVATLSTGVDSGKKVDRQIDLHHQERIKKLNERLELRVTKQTGDLLDSLDHIKRINENLQHQIQKRFIVEQKLLKIQRIYDAMVHHFPDGVIGVIDRDMKYVLLDGKEIHEIDLPAIGLFKPGSSETRDAILEEEILGKLMKVFEGESASFEVKVHDRFYHISGEPLPDASNSINEILCVLKNVTARRRMEESLLYALEKEKELVELKSRFVTTASHEFKTPLATILSSAFLLENYIGEDYVQEKKVHTGRIKKAVDNLTDILNEFLTLEKHEDRQIRVINREIKFPDFLLEIIQEIDPHKKKGQHINYEHAGDLQTCRVDPHLLWSILTNLISNALKYSGEQEEVKIKSEIKNNQITFLIKDPGMGIPEAEQKNIFGLFFRASNALNFQGAGLGLHLVQKNVKLLKGTIGFTSELGAGTAFTIVLPCENHVPLEIDQV